MSIAVSRRVWESSKASGGAFTVLLALADYATDDGVAWPGIDALAQKSRLSVRATQYAINQLRAAGEITVEAGGGRHRTHQYVVHLAETVQDLHPITPVGPAETVQPVHPASPETPQDLHPLTQRNGANDDTNGANDDRNGADPAPNPSLTTRSTVSTPRKKQDEEIIREIYEHYRAQIFPGARSCPTDKIRARLKTFTADELKAGIDNFAAHEWSMEHNAHRGAAWFFKNDERSETYLHLKPDAERRNDHSPELPVVNGTASKVTPPTDADREVWARALGDMAGLMSAGNFETYYRPLEVGGRNESGGLCLVVPPTLTGSDMLRNCLPMIRRALADAGDAAPMAVAFKARRTQGTNHVER